MHFQATFMSQLAQAGHCRKRGWSEQNHRGRKSD